MQTAGVPHFSFCKQNRFTTFFTFNSPFSIELGDYYSKGTSVFLPRTLLSGLSSARFYSHIILRSWALLHLWINVPGFLTLKGGLVKHLQCQEPERGGLTLTSEKFWSKALGQGHRAEPAFIKSKDQATGGWRSDVELVRGLDLRVG